MRRRDFLKSAAIIPSALSLPKAIDILLPNKTPLLIELDLSQHCQSFGLFHFTHHWESNIDGSNLKHYLNIYHKNDPSFHCKESVFAKYISDMAWQNDKNTYLNGFNKRIVKNYKYYHALCFWYNSEYAFWGVGSDNPLI